MLSKIQYSQAAGDWNFQNLKLGLEVFLNFFPCVYNLFSVFFHSLDRSIRLRHNIHVHVLSFLIYYSMILSVRSGVNGHGSLVTVACPLCMQVVKRLTLASHSLVEKFSLFCWFKKRKLSVTGVIMGTKYW